MPFADTLIDWYYKNKRNLPWRETSDPYKIWLSEIILQQTRIEQGKQYYLNFIGKYDSIEKFAAAHENDILKLWQGLGYYSRALNAHHAAKIVVEEYGGEFPADYDQIIKLKGIGKYTAAAIMSIAFNMPYAVVDGNVKRFLSRIYGLSIDMSSSRGEKIIRQKAGELMDKKKPGDFNQALMEFGALQCTPLNPDCGHCPFISDCVAYSGNKVSEYPVKKSPTKQKPRYFNYLLITDAQEQPICLEKRGMSDIWKNMYQLPLIETQGKISSEELQRMKEWESIFGKSAYSVSKEILNYRHVLTHRVIHASFYRVIMEDWKNIPRNINIIEKLQIGKYPIPRIIEKFLQEVKILP